MSVGLGEAGDKKFIQSYCGLLFCGSYSLSESEFGVL